MKLHQFIEKNIEVVNVLVRNGIIRASDINYYNIYAVYKSANISKKMDRYYFTSITLKIDSRTVQKAVRIMESNIR